MRAQHRKFAAEYIKNGFIGVQAVYAAGYKLGYDSACVRASLLLRNVKVAKMIDNHLKKSKMGADQVVEELTDIAQAATPATIDVNQKLKALELLGRFHRLFTDKVETTNANGKDEQLVSAKRSFVLAALPELQIEHPDWSTEQLQSTAEARFTAWYDSLALDRPITDTVQ